MKESVRVRKEVRSALRKLHYVVRQEAKGFDVSRIEESREKAIGSLTRHRRCFVCGTKQENAESIRLWEQDQMGSECRRRYPDWQTACFDPAQAVA